MSNMNEITGLYQHGEKGWGWDVTDEDGETRGYSTYGDGTGLRVYVGSNDYRQIAGTCDWGLNRGSQARSAVLARIKRFHA